MTDKTIGLVVALPLALLVCGCWPQPKWGGTERFVNGLGCGMSLEELRDYASAERGLRLYPQNPDRPEVLVASKGNTTIELWPSTGGLEAHQVRWIDTIKHVAEEERVELCEEEKP